MTVQELADNVYSWIIRTRDNWTCIFCGYSEKPPTRNIQNSHYVGRQHKATRFLDTNCDALCYGCHKKHEANKQLDYQDFKINQLGNDNHDNLKRLARTTIKWGNKQKLEKLKEVVERAQRENIYQILPLDTRKQIDKALKIK